MQSTLNEAKAAHPHGPQDTAPEYHPKPLRLPLRSLRIERVSLILDVGPD